MNDFKKSRDLLLACLRPGANGDAAASLARLTAADWQVLARESMKLGVAPLLYHRLKSFRPGVGVPGEIAPILRGQYLESAARNLGLYGRLSKVLRLLQSNGLPVIVLKGAHLAEVIYDRIAVRPMADADLLVRLADLPEVGHGLSKLGYAPDMRNGTEHSNGCSHYSYISLDRELTIEIHWHIDGSPSPFHVDVEGLWERASPASVAGVQTLSLSPEDLLLHLCIHCSFHHLFSVNPLRSLCDISETILHYRDQIDWELLRERSRQWGTSNALCFTLRLASRLLGVNAPDWVREGLAPDGMDERMVAWAESRIFEQPSDAIGPASDLWGRLHASRGLRKKTTVLLEACFPPARRLSMMYSVPQGSRRLYLYYPVRWKDLVRRHAGRSWLLLSGDGHTKTWIRREARRVEDSALLKQALEHDKQTAAWIGEDLNRAERAAMVRWLASC